MIRGDGIVAAREGPTLMKKSLNLLEIAKGSVIRVPLLPFIGVGPLLGCLEESRALITDHDDPNEEQSDVILS